MAYSEKQKKEILEFICDQLIEGKSLRRICLDSKDMPNAATIFRWMADEESEYATIIARARNVQADALFDDMSDLVNRMIDEGLDPSAVRTAIWAKQWQAGKLKPKKYGDRIENINTNTNHDVKLTDPKDVDEAAQAYMDMINGSKK